MIAPLAGFPVAGVIWYQGESNVGTVGAVPHPVPDDDPRLARRAWGAGAAVPVRAAPQLRRTRPVRRRRSARARWAELTRGAGGGAAAPETAMAVALDIGDGRRAPPAQQAGRRTAAGAAGAALVYGKDVIATGPTFRAASREGGGDAGALYDVAGGLVTADGAPPCGFISPASIAIWHRGEREHRGRSSSCVSSPDVPEPVAVRYGWANDPPNTLRNQADLPAGPFRTDDWLGGRREEVSTRAR